MLWFPILLCAHLLAATFWVGGMATMVFAVRPSLDRIEAPVQRQRFMVALLGRLFDAVVIAIAVLFASGLALVARSGGWPAAPWPVHAMAAVALLMALIFVFIRLGPYARVRLAVTAGETAAAGAGLARIRRLIGVNLALGVIVFVIATLGRAG